MSSKEQVHSDDKATAKPRSSRREVQNLETLTQQTHPAPIIRGARIAPSSLTSRDVLQLQRTIGNQAVSRLLAREGTGCPTVQRASGEGQLPERTVQKQVSEMMGHDFSGVRVHSDSEPDALSTQLTAKAFTAGPDIFFKRGAHDPAFGSGMPARPAGDAFKQEADALAQGVADRATEGSESRRALVSKLHSPTTAPRTIQRDWDLGSVRRVFRAKEGEDLAKYGVKRGAYKLYKVDTLNWQEKKYRSKRDWLGKKDPVETISHQAKAYHHRPTKEIGISRDFDNNEAAATIVHEATHAGQYEKAEEKKEAMADLVEREVEAHVNEEEFRIKHKMPPKTSEIKRNEEKGEEEVKQVVNRDSVRAFVKKKYGSLEQKVREAEEKGGSVEEKGGPAEEKFFIMKEPRPIRKNFKNRERVA